MTKQLMVRSLVQFLLGIVFLAAIILVVELNLNLIYVGGLPRLNPLKRPPQIAATRSVSLKAGVNQRTNRALSSGISTASTR